MSIPRDEWFLKRIPSLPRELENLFEVDDIPKVFNYLEKTFKLSKNWRAAYQSELLATPRGMNEKEFFFKFMLVNIDPSLKVILKRHDSIIFALSMYLIKHKIDEVKRRLDLPEKYTPTNIWKKRP